MSDGSNSRLRPRLALTDSAPSRWRELRLPPYSVGVPCEIRHHAYDHGKIPRTSSKSSRFGRWLGVTLRASADGNSELLRSEDRRVRYPHTKDEEGGAHPIGGSVQLVPTREAFEKPRRSYPEFSRPPSQRLLTDSSLLRKRTL